MHYHNYDNGQMAVWHMMIVSPCPPVTLDSSTDVVLLLEQELVGSCSIVRG